MAYQHLSTIHLSTIDRIILGVDTALRTLSSNESLSATRESPATYTTSEPLDEMERKKSAGLMRVNHTGEVCAQALYQGQALTAKLPQVRGEMEKAAQEEIDHLLWCQERLTALNSHTSYLNPAWYGLSFAIGAAAGLVSDKISLGFVAATEDQVCQHLEKHLQELPEKDQASRAVVQQMLIDEAKHAETALAAGGYNFPAPVKSLMTLTSTLMTKTSYYC
jgi:3-demethoxyubiquinol 3-hydroxylase